ncbi:diacylglycerol/lipid kinase family protein [Flavobacterium algicola]|uniref:diacylglycerol/lipid kinase family protein n=1 Tax=Flavobacterium algicola TaxID=556529 RepID=UPI001EFE0FF5|nr:diacylglycerol kinase family protein [Flavobacterium algicola]MCG9791316.1 diacylglycerol kinase [Flavobacterium algicola]
MKNNVILIVNPISGDIDKTDMVKTVSHFTTRKDKNFVLYETQGTNDIFNIKELFLKHTPERVLIAGGDGTIKLVAEALEQEDVIFGILPAGSANGLATDLGLPETVLECLEIAFKDNVLDIDMVLINGKNSLHLSDIGLNAELIKNYEKSTVRGKLGYAIQAVNTLIEREDPFSAIIDANGKTIECEARMIVIANSQKYGTGIVINPNGLMTDGKFELIILKNLDLIVIGQIIAGNTAIETQNLEIISTDCARIITNRPVNFQIDGEYCGTESTLNVKMATSKMKVAVPIKSIIAPL